MNALRFLSIGVLYLVAVFFAAPVYFVSVGLYAIYFRSLFAPLLIALLIDAQFATVTGFIPWYLLGTAVTLVVVYWLRPFIRFAPQS
jgi:hypothetical protein